MTVVEYIATVADSRIGAAVENKHYFYQQNYE